MVGHYVNQYAKEVGRPYADGAGFKGIPGLSQSFLPAK
jgi:hypothetical protein